MPDRLAFLAPVFARMQGIGPDAPTLSEHEAAELMSDPLGDLAGFRELAIGPVCALIDGRWLYFEASVREWIERRGRVYYE